MRATSRRRVPVLVLVAMALLVGWVVSRSAGNHGADFGQSSRTSASQGTTAGPVGSVGSVGPVGSVGEPTERQTASSDPSGSATDPMSGLRWIAESALPREARDTLVLIARGGPFPYPRNDNQAFQNREGLLPPRPAGYYREFTVGTPGSDDRGPRRIVTGAAGETYWTDDHYDSFKRIREGT